MPFTAKRRSTGEMVCVWDYPDPRRDLRAEDLVCPLCEEPLTLRAGLVRSAHFAHRSRCPREDWYEPETPEHRAFKQAVRDWLLQDPFWQEAQIFLEVPIHEARRRADLLAVFPGGWRVAHECQVSPITLEELQTRSENYLQAGVDVLWWFTRQQLRRSQEWLPQWLLRFQGIILTADIRVERGEEKLLWRSA